MKTLGQTADTSAPGYSGTALVSVALGSMVVGGLIGWALGTSKSKPRKLPHEKGAGYYVLLYNYPRGNRDRRLKGFDGPFASRSAADVKAEREKRVWYPTVRKLTKDPRTLGM